MSVISFIKSCSQDPALFIRRLRWEFWKFSPEIDILTDSKHGKIVSSSKDQIISRALYLTREFAYSEIEDMFNIFVDEKLLRPEQNLYLVDVGANIGTTCVPLVKFKKFKKAIAIEPDNKNFKYLEKNCELNNISANVNLKNCAISSQSGWAEIAISETNFGDHRILSSSQKSNSEILERSTKKVKLKTLDEVLSEENIAVDDVDLLWIDTQGHESFVLQGAELLLNRPKGAPPVLIEFWPKGLTEAGTDIADFCSFLKKNFSEFIILQDGKKNKKSTEELLVVARILEHDNSYADFLLLPKKKI